LKSDPLIEKQSLKMLQIIPSNTYEIINNLFNEIIKNVISNVYYK